MPNVIIDDNGSHYIKGTSGKDHILGNGGNDTIEGFGSVDYMDGGTGIDTVRYMYTKDAFWIDLAAEKAQNLIHPGVEDIKNFENVLGSQGNDQIYGTNGVNDLEGENGNDLLSGRGGHDVLEGENGNDFLYGGTGNDSLYGGVGNDWLYGGPGKDTLNGGAGSDRFVFKSASDSPGGVMVDVIKGFQGAGPWLGGPPPANDVIDVSAIDANTGLPGDQKFQFLGDLPVNQAVFQPGALWVSEVNGNTMLYGNTDGDAARELIVRIEDGTTLASYYQGPFAGDDFVL